MGSVAGESSLEASFPSGVPDQSLVQITPSDLEDDATRNVVGPLWGERFAACRVANRAFAHFCSVGDRQHAPHTVRGEGVDCRRFKAFVRGKCRLADSRGSPRHRTGRRLRTHIAGGLLSRRLTATGIKHTLLLPGDWVTADRLLGMSRGVPVAKTHSEPVNVVFEGLGMQDPCQPVLPGREGHLK